MAFETSLYIRFNHVDFARVVYFPKFFDYCHHIFEDFVQAEFGKSYHKLMEEEGVGFPVVHAEADFKQTLRFGDTARVLLEVLSLGKTSLKCRYVFFRVEEGKEAEEGGGEGESAPTTQQKTTPSPAATLTLTGACVDMKTFKPTPIPARWRSMLAGHLQT